MRHLNILKKEYPKMKRILLRHNQCEKTDKYEYGLTGCVTTIEQALEFSPDAAIIATPATKHIDIALTLASAGVHLLIEKPISATTDGVSELIDFCDSKNIVLMTGYNLRFQSSLQAFREQVSQKRVGDILLVRAEVGQYLPNWRPGNDYRKAVSAQKKTGGGVLLELSHELDYIGWVFGDYRWVKSHISKQSDLEIDVEDNAVIILGLNSENNKEIVVSLNMDFIRHDDIRLCTAIGDNGSLRWDAIKGEVSIFEKTSNKWSVIFSKHTGQDYTYKCEIDNFIASIEQKENIFITGLDGLKTVKVIEAIHQSHNNNRMVTL